MKFVIGSYQCNKDGKGERDIWDPAKGCFLEGKVKCPEVSVIVRTLIKNILTFLSGFPTKDRIIIMWLTLQTCLVEMSVQINFDIHRLYIICIGFVYLSALLICIHSFIFMIHKNFL